MRTQLIELDITLSASSEYFSIPGVRGRLLRFQYIQDPVNPFTVSTDHILSGIRTARVFCTMTNRQASFDFKLRQDCHDPAGQPRFFNDAGDAPVSTPPIIAGETLRLYVHTGGTSKQGKYRLYVG